MNVRVIIQVSTPPTASNLDNLRSAASELSNNLKSVIVSTDEDSKGFSLITVFTMKTTAEYKVVIELVRSLISGRSILKVIEK